MNKILRYISVSHKTASTKHREKYHLSDLEKEQLFRLICNKYLDVSGLFILATCNRTEIYFEAIHTKSNEIIELLIDFKSIERNPSEQMVFTSSNSTENSIMHLLKVSSGLESLVFGDAEIISQIKKCHQFSMHYKMQGSLLERALQSVFKTHKRISNETNFRDGTTSVAYKALKAISHTYGNAHAKSKKILLVGAGDIVKQLFKYNSKFNFNHIHISNRSFEKAIILAQNNQCQTYPWERVLSNNFDDFDVIISAVSNCPDLIHKISPSKKTLLIDLAVPCSIDKRLKKMSNVVFHDLDSISVELEETREHRLEAAVAVSSIINDEIESYKEWLEDASVRALLSEFKKKVHTKVKIHVNALDSSEIIFITNQVMKKIAVQNMVSENANDIDHLIYEEISALHI